jgi:hypothetical protein
MSRELVILTALGLMLVVAGNAGAQPGKGSILIEEWLNTDGAVTDNVDTLHTYINSGKAPTRSYLIERMDRPDGGEDYWGGRMRGYLYPPQTGDYTFWTCSDDDSEVWLSTDESPVNVKMICNVEGWLDYQDWTYRSGSPGGTYQSAPVRLQAGRRYYVEVYFSDGTGGGFDTVAWGGPGIGAGPVVVDGQYLSPAALPPSDPVHQARNPVPADGAMEVSNPLFSWSPGSTAVLHNVYVGTDPNLGPENLVLSRTSMTSYYHLPGLTWGTTYYWRVDEIDAVGVTYAGSVWSFTTLGLPEPIPVPPDVVVDLDDFEGYTAGSPIYETWIDGFVNGTGSRVGHPFPPFVEQTIVLSGVQSMPMYYDNATTPFYSETYRQWSPLQDWTTDGATDLSLWVRGYPATVTVTNVDGRITIPGEGTDIWNDSDQFTYHYKTLSGDGSIFGRVLSDGMGSNTWAKGGVMIRASLEAGSAHAMMILTGGAGNGASFQWRTTADQGSSNADKDLPGIAPPYYVMVERTGNSFSGYVSPDGVTWTQLGATQYIAMGTQVYIGMCVTSHAAGEYRTFVFENVGTTGSVGLSKQTAEIGLTRNSPQTLYVLAEDSTGRTGIVRHPDPAITTVADWTEWRIPLGQFAAAGVNLTRIRRMYVGVGNRTAGEHVPMAVMASALQGSDATGILYFDSFGILGPPAKPWFKGQVLDKATGTPICGAVITFTCPGVVSYTAVTSGPPDCQYSIVVRKGCTYTVIVSAPGYNSNTFTLVISGDSKPAITMPTPNPDVAWTAQTSTLRTIGLDISLTPTTK